MNTEPELIYSPLQQTYTENGESVEIYIYRLSHSGWTMEVVDRFGNSTVWDGEFATDQHAMDEFLRTIKEEGIQSVVGMPSGHANQQDANEAEQVEWGLPDEELARLDAFLKSPVMADDTMPLVTLDGYLTAVVIGPTTLLPSQWFPGIWGVKQQGRIFDSLESAQQITGLIMQRYNVIIASFEYDADAYEPLFGHHQPETGRDPLVEAQMWAYGFMRGVALSVKDWQVLFDDPQGAVWIDPFRMLGGGELDEMEKRMSETPEHREMLARQIRQNLAHIYRFWLPHRKAEYERQIARAEQAKSFKVGRNDPCPCGSGKKFKKCCGAVSNLH